MLTKFGFLVDFDPPNTVASTSTKPEVVLTRRGRHLQKPIMTSCFCSRWSDLDEILQPDAK